MTKSWRGRGNFLAAAFLFKVFIGDWDNMFNFVKSLPAE